MKKIPTKLNPVLPTDVEIGDLCLYVDDRESADIGIVVAVHDNGDVDVRYLVACAVHTEDSGDWRLVFFRGGQ